MCTSYLHLMLSRYIHKKYNCFSKNAQPPPRNCKVYRDALQQIVRFFYFSFSNFNLRSLCTKNNHRVMKYVDSNCICRELVETRKIVCQAHQLLPCLCNVTHSGMLFHCFYFMNSSCQVQMQQVGMQEYKFLVLTSFFKKYVQVHCRG